MILHSVAGGAGPRTAVLLHGLFGSAQSFATVQRHLPAGWRCLAIDLRNHGASPHAFGMAYDDMAGDVVATLEAAGVDACALIGHSMGGKVAMRVALTAPALVGRLLVSDIAPRLYQAHFGGYPEAMARLPLAPDLTRAAASAALAEAVPDLAVRNFLLQNLRFGAGGPVWRIGLAEIADGLAAVEDWPPVAGTYTGPTLVVAGERSDYIRPDDRPAFRALFPKARFVQVKDAGHWVHADNFRGFLSVLEAFLTPH